MDRSTGMDRIKREMVLEYISPQDVIQFIFPNGATVYHTDFYEKAGGTFQIKITGNYRLKPKAPVIATVVKDQGNAKVSR